MPLLALPITPPFDASLTPALIASYMNTHARTTAKSIQEMVQNTNVLLSNFVIQCVLIIVYGWLRCNRWTSYIREWE